VSPGLLEDVSKALVSVAETMKTQPLALSLIAVNILFLIVFYWLISSLAVRTANDLERADDLIAQLIMTCGERP
jgi:hypothetical protein